jgi:RNA polymerase sigma factor (sigma-70 family)
LCPPLGLFSSINASLWFKWLRGLQGNENSALLLYLSPPLFLVFVKPAPFPPQSLPRQAFDLSESGNRFFPFPKLWFGQEANSYKESEAAGICWPGPLNISVFVLDIHMQEDVYLRINFISGSLTAMDKLLIKAREGDEKAERDLFQYLFVRFGALAKRRIGKGEAEDIAQEACVTVLQKYKTETFTKGFEAWAYGVLKMKIGNYMQGLMVKQKSLAPESKADQTPRVSSPEPDYDLKRKLINCLKQIIKRNRLYARALNFVHQGYKAREISRRLRIKPNNFYVILNRGRRLLRICLETGAV